MPKVGCARRTRARAGIFACALAGARWVETGLPAAIAGPTRLMTRDFWSRPAGQTGNANVTSGLWWQSCVQLTHLHYTRVGEVDGPQLDVSAASGRLSSSPRGE